MMMPIERQDLERTSLSIHDAEYAMYIKYLFSLFHLTAHKIFATCLRNFELYSFKILIPEGGMLPPRVTTLVLQNWNLTSSTSTWGHWKKVEVTLLTGVVCHNEQVESELLQHREGRKNSVSGFSRIPLNTSISNIKNWWEITSNKKKGRLTEDSKGKVWSFTRQWTLNSWEPKKQGKSDRRKKSETSSTASDQVRMRIVFNKQTS